MPPVRRRSRLLAPLTVAVLAPLATLLATVPLTHAAEGPPTPTGAAARGPAGLRAEITWTEHGIPHIEARNVTSLGYGSGYAATEMTACTLFDTLVTGRGQRSRWFGPEGRYNDQVTLDATNLQVDTLVTDLRDRKVVETLLADEVRGPGRESRQLVKGYVAGVNDWVRENDVRDEACRGAGYLRPDVTATDLWYGVYLANLLASTGVFVPQIADAAPPSPGDPGLPTLPVKASQVDRDALLTALGRDPEAPFGSNATAAGSAATSTGRGMLLGNPHFPWRGRYHFL